MHRLLPARLLCSPRSAVLLQSLRASGTSETPGSKTPNIDIGEDDRWLEAEIADKFKTPEERYAFERQRQVMRKLVQKVTEEHEEKLRKASDEHHEKLQKATDEHHEKLQKAADDRTAQVEALQKQIKEMQKMVDNMTKK